MKGLNQSQRLLKLFLKAKQGNSQAFSKIYDVYFTPIYRYLYFQTKTREDGEDLTQKVFLKAFGNLKNNNSKIEKPNCYFFKIARNILIDYWRKRKEIFLANEDQFQKIPDQEENIMAKISKEEDIKRMKKNIKKLSPKKRQVMVLKYLCDLKNKEIAEILKIKEDAVRQNQSKAIKFLRKNYE
jgi:RNA polymerase sigma-70 factor (ECF subfamily)